MTRKILIPLLIFVLALGFYLFTRSNGSGRLPQLFQNKNSNEMYSVNIDELAKVVRLPNENVSVQWVSTPDEVVGLASNGNRTDGQANMVVGVRRDGQEYVFDIFLHPDYRATMNRAPNGANGYLNSHILSSFLYFQYGDASMDEKRLEYCPVETCDLSTLSIIQ